RRPRRHDFSRSPPPCLAEPTTEVAATNGPVRLRSFDGSRQPADSPTDALVQAVGRPYGLLLSDGVPPSVRLGPPSGKPVAGGVSVTDQVPEPPGGEPVPPVPGALPPSVRPGSAAGKGLEGGGGKAPVDSADAPLPATV